MNTPESFGSGAKLSPNIKPEPTQTTAFARKVFKKLQPVWAEKLGATAPGDKVHHAKELDLLDRYPRVFREDELNAFRNMRGIPAARNPDLHLSTIRVEWNDAYDFLDALIEENNLSPGTPEYNSYVRKFVDGFARDIDERYGDLFTDYGRNLRSTD
jgi:hypothetical protein